MMNTKEPQNRWTQIKTFLTSGSNRVKFYFILISVFLWFLSKLSKDGYTAVVEFPVKYVNISADKSFGRIPNDNIKVSINSPGFTILKYKLRSFGSLRIDLSKVEKRLDPRNSFWLTNSDLSLIENQLDPEVEVRSINPDTVFFDFNKLIKKKVAVRLNLIEAFSKDLGIYGQPILEPDSIWVRGPESLISKIQYLETETLELKGDKPSLKRKLDLILPEGKGLSYSANDVKIELEFSKMTEASMNIPIEIVGLPEKYNLKLFPENVKLTYKVAIRDFEKVRASDFRIYTDCSDIESNSDKRYLTLQSSNYPEFIESIHFDPKRVEFILNAK